MAEEVGGGLQPLPSWLAAEGGPEQDPSRSVPSLTSFSLHSPRESRVPCIRSWQPHWVEMEAEPGSGDAGVSGCACSAPSKDPLPAPGEAPGRAGAHWEASPFAQQHVLSPSAVF